MPKRRRRSFKPQFKAHVVLGDLAGTKSQAGAARRHKPELVAYWKKVAIRSGETLFQGGEQRAQAQEPIAELERMVGRVIMD
ncbi:transposase [Tautonia sociabilis]|uniref:Transposase n=1 Tax=Tautonia sociabilis TaxID=2080755 RepID=A0A432MC00_9BACT|nr:transposase [Tautonia sociabilis]RUL81413.1 transposase [Tautonia sociabilis]